MNAQTYQIAFSGGTLSGFDLVRVKQNLSRVFKIDATKTHAMFSGRKRVLKKNLDLAAAKKYQAALKKLGADVSIETMRENPMERPAVQTAAASGGHGVNSLPKANPGARSVPPIVARAAVDCASKPVSMVNVGSNSTAPAETVRAANKLGPILSFATENEPFDSESSGLRTQKLYSPTTDLKKPAAGEFKPAAAPKPDKASTTVRRSALEDLQKLLEKSKALNNSAPLANPASGDGSPVQKKDFTQTTKLPPQAPVIDEKLVAKRKAAQQHLAKLKSQQAIKTNAVDVPKKNPMATNPLLRGIQQKNRKPSAPVDRINSPGPLKAVAEVKPVSLPTPEIEQKAANESLEPVAEAPQLAPTVAEPGQENTVFEQPTLLSCIVCGQTQHAAPHCLNCNSVFDEDAMVDDAHTELINLLGHDDFEHTPLEKVLWPGVTVLLFLYTLIFNFNLPLITFWIPDDTFDDLISTELKLACKSNKTCIVAVTEQLENCIQQSGIYDRSPSDNNRAQLNNYLDRISLCIVDTKQKSFFGVGEDTPFKNLQQ